MKCVVHFDMDPMPKTFNTPLQAVEAAEDFLLTKGDTDDQTITYWIKWRLDDKYPDHFVKYSKDDLLKHLKDKGEVTLQLVGTQKGERVLGQSVTVATAKKEAEDNAEAQAELDKLGQEMADQQETDISISAEGKTHTFHPKPAKKK